MQGIEYDPFRALAITEGKTDPQAFQQGMCLEEFDLVIFRGARKAFHKMEGYLSLYYFTFSPLIWIVIIFIFGIYIYIHDALYRR